MPGKRSDKPECKPLTRAERRRLRDLGYTEAQLQMLSVIREVEELIASAPQR
jgi:hypothetical protein